MPYISVYDNDNGKITLDIDTLHKIFNASKKRLTENEQTTFEELLDKLEDIEIDNVDVYLRSIHVSEDDISEAYEDYVNDDRYQDGYEEGYEDGVDSLERESRLLHINYGCLLQKLEQIAYHYGNPQQFTDKDAKEILEIINNKA